MIKTICISILYIYFLSVTLKGNNYQRLIVELSPFMIYLICINDYEMGH